MATVTQVISALETGQTLRFHTEARKMIKTQDVAQHVHGMLWLVLLLTNHMPSKDLLIALAYHDAGERWTGDMPSPTKRRIPGLAAALDDLEEERLREQLGPSGCPRLSAADEAILKLVDALDGCFMCDRETKLGNKNIRKMYQNFTDYAESARREASETASGLHDAALAYSIIMYHQGVIANEFSQ